MLEAWPRVRRRPEPGVVMQIVPDDMHSAGTYRYIGDTLGDVITHVARRTVDDDLDTAVEVLKSQLVAFGASRVADDSAWCRYAVDAARRGEPLSIVV
jgi:hypothetical protein